MTALVILLKATQAALIDDPRFDTIMENVQYDMFVNVYLSIFVAFIELDVYQSLLVTFLSSCQPLSEFGVCGYDTF